MKSYHHTSFGILAAKIPSLPTLHPCDPGVYKAFCPHLQGWSMRPLALSWILACVSSIDLGIFVWRKRESRVNRDPQEKPKDGACNEQIGEPSKEKSRLQTREGNV